MNDEKVHVGKGWVYGVWGTLRGRGLGGVFKAHLEGLQVPPPRHGLGVGTHFRVLIFIDAKL